MATRSEKAIKSVGWRRAVLSLVVLSWAGVSAQPCLMAMEMGQESPAISEQHHEMHGSHDSDQHAEQPCDHCPPDAGAKLQGCAVGMNADCGDVVEYSAESRKSEFKPKFADVGDAFVGPPESRLTSPSNLDRSWHDPGLLKRRTGPSRSIQFCVFLK